MRFSVMDADGNPVRVTSARVVNFTTGDKKAEVEIVPRWREGETGVYEIRSDWQGLVEQEHYYRIFWLDALQVRKVDYQAAVEVEATGFVSQRVPLTGLHRKAFRLTKASAHRQE